jgi:ABC-2 type transport system ATP-binding protein
VTEPPVLCEALEKRYGDLAAVDGVDLRIEVGDVYGYLGPNGAGKTTSMRMMLGLIRPTGGRALLFGRDPQREGKRALTGVAGFVEAPRFYPYLTGRKNLELLAAFDGGDARNRIGEVLDLVELTDRAGDKVGGYSHGMRQRLGIAGALLRNPRLLMLDEPTTGLDPAGIRDMKALVRRLSAEGITVLLSSHQMAEVEELCNRVGIIQRGRILYEGTIEELLSQVSTGYRLRTTDMAATLRTAQGRGIDTTVDGEEAAFSASEETVAALSIDLGRAGIGIRSLEREGATLEQLFFRLTEGDGVAPDGRPQLVQEVA